MTTAPYFWIRKIASHLYERDAVPLLGLTAPFDWAHFSSTLAARLGVQDFSIAKTRQEWKSADALQEGLGDDVLVLPLEITPFAGRAYWMMSKASIAKLATWMMHGQTKLRPLSSAILAEGFYRYILLQALDCMSLERPLDQSSIVLGHPGAMPETDAFCIDIAIALNKQSCFGRLALDPTLQRSWREHFSEPLADYIPTKITQVTELTASVKLGGVRLNPAEWRSLKPGDFIPLDSGSYDPRNHTGAASLTVDKMPLFQVKVKHGKIELIDYAFMYEEEMEKHPPKHHETHHSHEAESFPPATEEAVTLKELPIQLTVELARLRITLEKLIQLVPGNVIELPLQPDQPVHLTVNGQLVGKAELVHLGETLGIRVLEMG